MAPSSWLEAVLTKFQTYAHSNYPHASARARLRRDATPDRNWNRLEDGRGNWPLRHGLTKVRRMLPPQGIPPRLLRKPNPQSWWGRQRNNWQSSEINPILHRKSMVMLIFLLFPLAIKWEHNVKNPENEEFVVEVAFNLNKKVCEVTQDEFNERYGIKKNETYYKVTLWKR